jgi:RNA polymerase-binding transcription factor
MDEARAAELLATERARLERLLRAEIAATAPDQGDEVDDANWRIAEETGRAVSRSLRDRWSALQRAEDRLQRGTYGRSVSSGRPIPDERLEADPLAELLVEEAAVEAFRARHASESRSGLSSSTRRTLAALVDRDDSGDEPARPADRGASRPQAAVVEDEDEAEVDETADKVDESTDDLDVEDVEDLEDGELIDDEEVAAAAEFEDEDEEDEEAEDEADEADEAEASAEDKDEEEAEGEPRPRRRRSGRR